MLTQSLKSLTKAQQKYVIKNFGDFKKRKGTVALVAKVIDRITGTQLSIEQGYGVMQPDAAKFSIEYISAFKGGSKTTDTLIQAQIQLIHDLRKEYTTDIRRVEKMAKQLKERCAKSEKELESIILKLAKIDLEEYNYDRSRVYKPIWDY